MALFIKPRERQPLQSFGDNMPKNLAVVDIKSTGSALDAKSKNSAVLDIKSTNLKPITEEVAYLDSKTISKGQPMGLLLSLTYPDTLTFNVART